MHLKTVAASWVVLTVFLAPPNTFAIQEVARGDLEKQYRQIQHQKLVDELQRITNTLGLQGDWAKELVEALESEVEGAVERFFAKRLATDGRTPENKWDPQLRARFWELACEKVPEDQSEFLKQLGQDTIFLEEVYDQVSQEAATSFLDSYLCLTSEQQAQVSSLISDIWDPNWNAHSGAMAANGFPFLEEIVFALDQEKLNQILNDEQQAAFTDINKLSTGRARLLMFKQGNADYGTLSMKETCERLLDLKIAEYDQLCQLDDRQFTFLAVAKKGAVNRVARSWDVLVEQLKADPDVMRRLGRDFAALRALAEPALQQCVNRPEWKITLSKILDEDQFGKVVAREKERLDSCRKQLASYVIFSNFGKRTKLLFTREQYQQLLELMESHFELEFCGDLISAMKGVHEITDGELEAILNTSQWETLKPVVDRERAFFEKMLEAQASEDGN